ncbi:MAG: DUF2357 domain-containing protein [Tenericutes bacterium]|nr:DUF2357 domain-containing protein [Mycoplasmatota bacterium]
MGKSILFDVYNKATDLNKEEFLDAIDSKLEVKNKFRKVIYDYSWLEKMEDTMYYLDNIMRNPKKFIINEEEVVKIEKARKVTVESIRHLTQHTSYIQEFDQKSGEVKPSKILNINKEEDYDMYENRFIYTLLVNMKMFIARVSGDCINGSNMVSDKNIKYSAVTKINSEKVGIDINLNATDSKGLNPSSKNGLSIAQRIDKVNLQIANCMNSDLIKNLEKAHVTFVRSPIKRTNVILKNPNFQKAMELWTFLESYDFNNVIEENVDDEYEDVSTFRDTMNDSFLLDYLVMNEMLNNGNSKYDDGEVSKYYINKIIKTFVDNNNDFNEDDFVKMLRDEFREIRRVKDIKLNRIRRIYQKDLNNYKKIVQNCVNILGN